MTQITADAQDFFSEIMFHGLGRAALATSHEPKCQTTIIRFVTVVKDGFFDAADFAVASFFLSTFSPLPFFYERRDEVKMIKASWSHESRPLWSGWPEQCSCVDFGGRPATSNVVLFNSQFSLQRALVTTQTDKDKVETELLKQQEKVNILETQVVKSQKDRENLQTEMEMLLDRINKLSELLDKSRVGTSII